MMIATEFPLDPGFVANNKPDAIRARLRQIVRSVRFQWFEPQCRLRLMGPDLGYHGADPHLRPALADWDPPLTLEDVGHYRGPRRHFDLCLDDCWSGYFIAEDLATYDGDLVLIHLDDHTDMMPTLLTLNPTEGIASATSRRFDPVCPTHWAEAIRAGCISIGDFITPLFYSGRRVHVRHLNNVPPSEYQPRPVFRAPCAYTEFPGCQFASLKTGGANWHQADGSYVASDDPAKLLKELPQGKLIVHIDLDYFINDFNGNIGASAPLAQSELRRQARLKLTRFFAAITPIVTRVDRWIVATSPGFCCALHWDWLLEEISQRISCARRPG